MTETKLLKLAVRKFILNKLRETTLLELGDLAADHNLSAFYVAECFDHELWRIDKVFGYPEVELPQEND